MTRISQSEYARMRKQPLKITPRKILESDIRKAVRDYLRYKGWFVFHILQGLGSYRGVADLIAVKDGKVRFIELKKGSGVQSDVQKDFQCDIEDHGGIYIIARGIEDVEGL